MPSGTMMRSSCHHSTGAPSLSVRPPFQATNAGCPLPYFPTKVTSTASCSTAAILKLPERKQPTSATRQIHLMSKSHVFLAYRLGYMHATMLKPPRRPVLKNRLSALITVYTNQPYLLHTANTIYRYHSVSLGITRYHWVSSLYHLSAHPFSGDRTLRITATRAPGISLL